MDRPNVLLVHTDQQRWDAVAANGNDEIHTPNLDRLAAEGVSFERSFVQAPVCMPSRMSYLTGQYPSQLGIYSNGVELPTDALTLPRLLDGYGYETSTVGKLHFRNHSNRDHREPHPDYGFDRYEVSDEPGTYRDAYRAWVKQTAPEELDAVSTGPSPLYDEWRDTMSVRDGIEHLAEQEQGAMELPHSAEVTHSAFVADRTMDVVSDSPDRFCCVAGFYPPHILPRANHPWGAPREFLDLYDPDDLTVPDFPPEAEAERRDRGLDDESLRDAMHGYYAMVSEVDHHVGRILDHLESLDVLDETLVVFTSDHGEYLGEHLTFGKGFPGHDASARVPLLVRWPEGVADPGRHVDDIVEAVDLVPTILDAAGVQVPPHLRGTSLLPVLRGDDHPGPGSALVEGEDHALGDGYRGRVGRALRTDSHHYVMAPGGAESLYDLDAEYGAYRDVSDDDAYADVLADHRRRLLQRVNDAAVPEPRSWVY
jgi:arylsulfatase A-like enzyme